MRINKDILVMGAGAGIGIIIPAALRKFYPGQKIPYIGDTLGDWGTYDTFIPLVTGAGTFLISQFTHIIHNDMINDFLAIYGITALATGLLNGIFPATMSSAARLQPMSQGVTRSRFGNGFTPVYQPSVSVKARGFGSDTSRPPTAATQTKITKDIVYA